MESKKIIIVGAGLGGLAAGHWLTERGIEVEILEASDRPCGRMVTLERNGDRVDVGAQFFHSNYRRAFRLMDEMNLTGAQRPIKGRVQYTLDDGTTFLYDHRVPYMKMLGVRGNLKLYWFILRYVMFGRRFPMYRISKDIPEYDDREVLDLFTSPSDKALRDYIVTGISMGENTGLPEWMSLYHFIHQFRLTTFTTFVGLTRGVASLPEELAKRLPVRYESPVQQLVTDNGRVTGVQMASDGSVKKAAHVIVAVAPHSAGRMMPQEFTQQKRFFDSVVYAPLPMPVFFLDRPLRRDVWCYFNDPSLKRTFMFAIDEHSKLPEMCPGGKAILTGWSGHPMTLELIDQPDDEIIEKARQDIELMVPGFSDWIEEVTVYRHPYATARYPVGAYRRILDFLDQAQQLKGVSFVSDLFGGNTMEGTLISAETAVGRIGQ